MLDEMENLLNNTMHKIQLNQLRQTDLALKWDTPMMSKKLISLLFDGTLKY